MSDFTHFVSGLTEGPRMPVVFVGHGSPMNAIEDNAFTRSLKKAGTELKQKTKPSAILVISAHWLTNGTFINNADIPPTIHDFGGFPNALYAMQYPVKGAPQYAAETATLVTNSQLTKDWGLDHGAWTILLHLFPQADIPVYQMSIDYGKPMQYHFDLAKQLTALRDKGVLIIGSGNVVHNLGMSFKKMQGGDDKPYDWALEFDRWVGSNLKEDRWKELVAYDKQPAGKLSAPTPEHYIPLLYVAGLAQKEEQVHPIYESVEYGGLSMRTFSLGK